MVIKISSNALESALLGAKNNHPNEFIGLLREKGGIITELLLAPLQVSDENSAYFPIYAVPTDPTIIGTFHSHPSYGVPRPSIADRHLFSRHYKCHFISSLPYIPTSTRAFGNSGEPLDFSIVD
ncbi:MAG: Mov34/MPN/PAD-1 family protein [Candidatus Micrarchaeota archaeon]